MSMVSWKSIPGYEGFYQASIGGRIRSLDRIVEYSDGRRTLHKGITLKPGKCKRGYRRVTLWKNNISKSRLISRLILRTFVGNCPSGMEVCHNDNDPSNNKLANLRYDTPKANNLDKKKFETCSSGERNAGARLTEKQVIAMRSQYAKGKVTLAQIAFKYKISNGHTWAIINGRCWKHLPVL